MVDSSSEFAAIPLRSSVGFSWVFLVELIVVGIAVIFVLFYFNRVVGTIISLSIRWYTWHKYRVFIDVRSIQVSFLGGRIFFKELRYIGTNETVFAVQGHFTWRYWLNHTRVCEILCDPTKTEKNGTLPSRFRLQVEGLEWFVYNRTPAYEAALNEYENANAGGNAQKSKRDSDSYDSTRRFVFSSEKDENEVTSQEQQQNSGSGLSSTVTRPSSGIDSEETEKSGSAQSQDGVNGGMQTMYQSPSAEPQSCDLEDSKLSVFLEMLPIEIICEKGAIVMGNQNTPTIAVYHFSTAIGNVNALPSRSRLDHYKMAFDFEFQQPVVQLKANMDYSEPNNSSQQNENADLAKNLFRNQTSKWQSFLDFISFLVNRRSYNSQTNETEQEGDWQGLQRYLDEDDLALNEDTEQLEEYAKCTSVLDARSGRVVFYYDIAGLVPDNPEPVPLAYNEAVDIGAGGLPPEWGVDVHIKGGTIQYGPWADRQRAYFFNSFFPSARVDAVPRERLSPGEVRIPSEMKVYLEIDESTILRIPVREPSKDAEFKKAKKLDEASNEIRSFGWIELKMAELSTVVYSSALVASENGFPHYLSVELASVDIRSSVNHDILWSSKKLSITGDLRSALKWNGLETWIFDCEAAGVEAFFLREHVTMITDMIDDFTSGPATPYQYFVPQHYLFNLALLDFQLHLNVNDSNIISNPTDFEDNIFLTFASPKLLAQIDVPLTQISPVSKAVSFKILGEKVDLNLQPPGWNTFASFLKSKEMGKVAELDLQGSYTYAVAQQPAPIDTLVMDVAVGDVTLIAYGFLIRYFLKIRENYFGDNAHFKTLEEFTRAVNDTGSSINDNVHMGGILINDETTESENDEDSSTLPHANETNDIPPPENSTDVLVSFRLDRGCLILPRLIYSAEEHFRLDLDSFDVDLRFTNFYMDLQIDISPIRGAALSLPPEKVLTKSREDLGISNPEVFIDGISVYGHRMFGLPPTEPTYVCNWDFTLGMIFTEGGPVLYEGLGDAISVFSHTFSDKENSLIVPEPPLYDVTLLRLKIPALRALCHTDKSTLEFMTSDITVQLNDLATRTYNSRVEIKIPDISFLCREKLDESLAGSRVLAYLNTAIYVTNFDRKASGLERMRLQQEHVRTEDAAFGRVPFFLMPEFEPYTSDRIDPQAIDRLAITLPTPGLPPSMIVEDRYTFLVSTAHNNRDLGIVSGENDSSASLGSVIHHDISASKSGPQNEKLYMDNFYATCESVNRERGSRFKSTFMPPYSCLTSFKDLEAVTKGFDRRIYDMDDGMIQSDIGSMRPLEDSETSYDAYVVEFRGGIDGFLSADGVDTLVEILDELSRPEPSAIYDSLQIDVIERLESNLINVNSILGLRVIIPGLHLRYGQVDNRLTDCVMMPPEIRMRDHIDLEVKGVTFSCHLSDKSMEYCGGRRNPVQRVSRVCFTFDHLKLGLVRYEDDEKPVSNAMPLELKIELVEVWNRSGTETETSSVKIRSMGFVAASQEMKWIVHTILDIVGPLLPISKKLSVIATRKENRTKNLIYLIAASSAAYEIAHDPAFLTRPAYILRSSNDHIRINDSWKLISRFRHIARALPQDINKEIIRDLHYDIPPPSDAKERTINILMRWRNWEMVDIQTSYIFAHVFDGESKHVRVTPSVQQLLIDIESVTLYLSNSTEHEDYLQLSYLTFSMTETTSAPALPETPILTVPTSDSREVTVSQLRPRRRHLALSIGCEEIRVITVWSSISLYEDITEVLDIRHEELQALRPKDSHRVSSVYSGRVADKAEEKSTEMCAQVVLSLKSVITVVHSRNFRVQCAGHTIECSVAANIGAAPLQQISAETVSSFLMRATALEVDILDPKAPREKRLLSLGVQRSDIWVSVSNLPNPKAARSFLRVADVTLELQEDTIGISRVITDIINDEVRQMCELFPMATTPAANNDAPDGAPGAKPSLSESETQRPAPGDIIGISIDLRNYRIILNVLPSLRFNVHGSAVQIIATPVLNGIRSVAFEAGEQVYEFRQRKKSRDTLITATKFPRVTTIIRIEDYPDYTRSASIRMNLDTVNFDASSFPTFASVLSGDVTKTELMVAQKEWNKTVNLLRQYVPDNSNSRPMENVKPPRDVSFQGSLYIKGIILKAESSNSELIMTIDNIKTEGHSIPDNGSDEKFRHMSLGASFPNIQIFLVNKIFQNGKFKILDTNVTLSVKTMEDKLNKNSIRQAIAVRSTKWDLSLSPYSSTLMVELLSQFEEKIMNLELPEFHLQDLLKEPGASTPTTTPTEDDLNPEIQTWDGIFKALIRIQLLDCAINWVSDDFGEDPDDFYLTIRSDQLRLASKGEGRIAMEVKQFAIVAKEKNPKQSLSSSPNLPKQSSSVMPEMSVYVALKHDGANRALDFNVQSSAIQVEIIPKVVNSVRAIFSSVSTTAETAAEKIRDYKNHVSAHHNASVSRGASSGALISTDQQRLLFSAINVKADFAGATISLYGDTNVKYTEEPVLGRRRSSFNSNTGSAKHDLSGPMGTLQVPGVHVMAEYTVSRNSRSLGAEVMIESSVNQLKPKVMPVVMEMIHYFKENIRERKFDDDDDEEDDRFSEAASNISSSNSLAAPSNSVTADAVFGNLEVNVGVRFERMEFSLSCEPIAKVAASVSFDGIFFSMNTFHKANVPKFVTATYHMHNLKASLQHIYSREHSAQVQVKVFTVSALSDQKISSNAGLSFISKVAGVDFYLNLKQSHDLLLFQDIWAPDHSLELSSSTQQKSADKRAELLVEKFHRVSSTKAFPWSVDFELVELAGKLDLGQSLGKLECSLDKIWLTSRKSSDWEQHLIFGICNLLANCRGRLGGSLVLRNIRGRSAIRWEILNDGRFGVPLVQVAAGLEKLETKLYFDYHLFLIATGSAIHLTMLNQRSKADGSDTLVCMADCDSIGVYLTVLAPSNILAILKTIRRIEQDRASSYQAVLRDSERFKINSVSSIPEENAEEENLNFKAMQLATSLSVQIRRFNVDIFPTALSDSEVLRVEAVNILARFSLGLDEAKLRSYLELKLDQFVIALSSTRKLTDDLNTIEVDKFARQIREAKGGTIIRIPAVSLEMTTWQPLDDMTDVEFIFWSRFDGRVDVGWNLGSINFIRDMWNTHVNAFSIHQIQSDGKPLSQRHIMDSKELEEKIREVQLNKMYRYTPLQPPVIATPQLKDMGEATPPVEWLGLNRDRLPGLTHQAIIVALQSMARKGGM
ncbi:hypothetical protein BZA70DRAFT_182677 [Myxozyma melibiosi]|uniref:Fermentation associated protein n=1 Tax=Myxozyma melibiosi TaxID=54550 RepID=A0ABR1F4L3_9ASCO